MKTIQTVQAMSMVEEKIQREMIALAAQRVKPATPLTPERVFDFRFAQKVSESMR
jgi:hypothetical protein